MFWTKCHDKNVKKREIDLVKQFTEYIEREKGSNSWFAKKLFVKISSLI